MLKGPGLRYMTARKELTFPLCVSVLKLVDFSSHYNFWKFINIYCVNVFWQMVTGEMSLYFTVLLVSNLRQYDVRFLLKNYYVQAVCRFCAIKWGRYTPRYSRLANACHTS